MAKTVSATLLRATAAAQQKWQKALRYHYSACKKLAVEKALDATGSSRRGVFTFNRRVRFSIYKWSWGMYLSLLPAGLDYLKYLGKMAVEGLQRKWSWRHKPSTANDSVRSFRFAVLKLNGSLLVRLNLSISPSSWRSATGLPSTLFMACAWRCRNSAWNVHGSCHHKRKSLRASKIAKMDRPLWSGCFIQSLSEVTESRYES